MRYDVVHGELHPLHRPQDSGESYMGPMTRKSREGSVGFDFCLISIHNECRINKNQKYENKLNLPLDFWSIAPMYNR